MSIVAVHVGWVVQRGAASHAVSWCDVRCIAEGPVGPCFYGDPMAEVLLQQQMLVC